MAEIKLEEGFQNEVSALASKGGTISNRKVSVAGGVKLPACDEFARAVNLINQAMLAYQKLIENDVEQLNQFIQDMKAVDNAGGGGSGSGGVIGAAAAGGVAGAVGKGIGSSMKF